MLYREVRPPPPLTRYVRLIWCLELDAGELGGSPERIATDGIVELVLHYRAPVVIARPGAAPATQPRSSLVSQTARWLEYSPAGPTGLVSVRFEPWGAHHFLGVPVSALADQIVAATEVWGDAVEALEEELSMASGTTRRIRLVERFLLHQLARHHKDDVEPLVRAVWRSGGRQRVSELCAGLGIGERRCQRLASAALGMSPKRLARITRFLAACSMLRRGEPPSLADVAVDCGYYDQSHLGEEVRTFSGSTPLELTTATSFSFLEIG